jgi:hypothetical protein
MLSEEWHEEWHEEWNLEWNQAWKQDRLFSSRKEEMKEVYDEWNEQLKELKSYHDKKNDFNEAFKVNKFNIELNHPKMLNVDFLTDETETYVITRELGKLLTRWEKEFLHELFLKWIKEE